MSTYLRGELADLEACAAAHGGQRFGRDGQHYVDPRRAHQPRDAPGPTFTLWRGRMSRSHGSGSPRCCVTTNAAGSWSLEASTRAIETWRPRLAGCSRVWDGPASGQCDGSGLLPDRLAGIEAVVIMAACGVQLSEMRQDPQWSGGRHCAAGSRARAASRPVEMSAIAMTSSTTHSKMTCHASSQPCGTTDRSGRQAARRRWHRGEPGRSSTADRCTRSTAELCGR